MGSTRVISIDVGMRNLALSVISHASAKDEPPKVELWDVVDLSAYALSKNVCVDEWVVSCSSGWNHRERCAYLVRCGVYAHDEKYNADDSKRALARRIRELKKSNASLANTLYATTRSLTCYLDETVLSQYSTDAIVAIENQPCMKNPTMKSVQVAIFTYFVIRGFTRVHFVNANKKLVYARWCMENNNVTDLKTRTEHTPGKSLAKKEAIAACTYILEHLPHIVHVSNAHVTRFSDTRKKDDLSDCLLQGLYVIDRERGHFT